MGAAVRLFSTGAPPLEQLEADDPAVVRLGVERPRLLDRQAVMGEEPLAGHQARAAVLLAAETVTPLGVFTGAPDADDLGLAVVAELHVLDVVTQHGDGAAGQHQLAALADRDLGGGVLAGGALVELERHGGPPWVLGVGR